MEEIERIHELTLEWGCITNLMNKISDIEDRIEGGWPELIDMMADAVTEEATNEDAAQVFFLLYSYLFRLYYRLKAVPTKRPFNRYSRITSHDGEKYQIYNYNYALYKWAIKRGFVDGISNSVILVPRDKLTAKEQRTLDRRCE